MQIQFEAAVVRRIWPALPEQQDWSKFNWSLIQEIFEDVSVRMSESSQNKLIEEIQSEYEARTKKDAPSRTAIQAKLKQWRLAT